MFIVFTSIVLFFKSLVVYVLSFFIVKEEPSILSKESNILPTNSSFIDDVKQFNCEYEKLSTVDKNRKNRKFFFYKIYI